MCKVSECKRVIMSKVNKSSYVTQSENFIIGLVTTRQSN